MKFKQIFIGLAFLSVTGFVSCKSDTPSTTDETTTTTPATEVAPQQTAPAAQSPNNGQIQIQPGSGDAQQINVQPATQQAPGTTAPGTAAPAGGSGKINPAHGQPGHSCAVPVGSPLP